MKRPSVFGALLAPTLGCGGSIMADPATASCRFETGPDASESASLLMCMEVTSNPSQVDGFASACVTPADAGSSLRVSFVHAPCPREGSIGGCCFTSPTASMTSWEDAPATADIAAQSCSERGGTWVEPWAGARGDRDSGAAGTRQNLFTNGGVELHARPS